MKKLSAGSLGEPLPEGPATRDIDVGEEWAEVLHTLTAGKSLRPVQAAAFCQHRILDSRRNLVVCAPTNSGKSIIGYAVLIDAVKRGQRAVLLEPLRALAQEQAESLRDNLSVMNLRGCNKAPKVTITTGDYRLENEMAASQPKANGEIIVATPERFDAILRNPEFTPWLNSIGAVVIDEAHLIADPRRGPVLELVVAAMRTMPAPPRIALLSATIGDPTRLSDWLEPCDVIESRARSPLRQEVWNLEQGDKADEVLAAETKTLLHDPQNAVLVFVYTRAMADALAARLSESLGQNVLAYHAGHSAGKRGMIRQAFRDGHCRCLVATTSLAMGVNLPATHVFVRDTHFFGHGKLGIAELIQILGRAGRGDRPGVGTVLIKPSDDWDAADLASQLADPQLPPLQSAFESIRNSGNLSRNADKTPDGPSMADSVVAACLSRHHENGISAEDLSRLLLSTLAGESLAACVPQSLQRLASPDWALAYTDEFGKWFLTRLGLAGVRTCLPLAYLVSLGQLVRDLLSLDPTGRLLGRWSSLDHLLLMSLASDRRPSFRKFSEPLAGQIESWQEAQTNESKSLLFSEWILGTEERSKAEELLGSLSVATGTPCPPRKLARQRTYSAMLNAILLLERTRGLATADLDTRWGVKLEDGGEETWRDSALWLAAGHTAVFDIRTFYHHVKENCETPPEQLRGIKRTFNAIRSQAFSLLDELKYCSPLGPMLRSLRRTRKGAKTKTVGKLTIRRLEDAGITSLRQLAGMTLEDLMGIGLRRPFAAQIADYVKRRSR